MGTRSSHEATGAIVLTAAVGGLIGLKLFGVWGGIAGAALGVTALLLTQPRGPVDDLSR